MLSRQKQQLITEILAVSVDMILVSQFLKRGKLTIWQSNYSSVDLQITKFMECVERKEFLQCHLRML